MPAFQQIVNSAYLEVNRLIISGIGDTSFFVSDGAARDSSNSTDMSVSAGVMVNCNVSGVINALDSGSLGANLDYYVFMIANSSLDQSPAFLVSRSSTAPLMPPSYDVFRRIGFLSTNGSSVFNRMYVTGTNAVKDYSYINGNLTATTMLLNGNSTTFATVPASASSYIPFQPGLIGTVVKIAYQFVPALGANSFQVKAVGDTSTTCFQSVRGPVATQVATGTFDILLTNDRKIQYLVSSGSDSLSLYVAGFKDYL